MHEYEKLYNRWKKYRLKKILKKISFFLLIASILFLLLFSYKKSLSPQKTDTDTNIKSNTHLQSLQTQSQQNNIILPEKSFEKHLKAPSTNHKSKKISPKKIQNKKKIKNRDKIQSHRQKKPISITEDRVPIKELEKIFQKSPTSSKALIIAKRYYQQKQYKQAAHWALKTNQLNKNNEESWLLFARSLAKIGKKREAIKILRIYYKKTHSQKAYLLLKEISK